VTAVGAAVELGAHVVRDPVGEELTPPELVRARVAILDQDLSGSKCAVRRSLMVSGCAATHVRQPNTVAPSAFRDSFYLRRQARMRLTHDGAAGTLDTVTKRSRPRSGAIAVIAANRRAARTDQLRSTLRGEYTLRRWARRLLAVVVWGLIAAAPWNTPLLGFGAGTMSVVAKCKNCYCGGPHAHPTVTTTSMMIQCPMTCDSQLKIATFCDGIDLAIAPGLIPPARIAPSGTGEPAAKYQQSSGVQNEPSSSSRH
jgi:hypothetical protein